MTVLIYGAGKIGRGLLGQIFSESGLEIQCVDIVPELIQALNVRQQYQLILATNESQEHRVIPVQGAVDGRDMMAVAQAIDQSELVAVAVGVRNLQDIAPFLAAGIEQRAKRAAPPLNMLICENLKDAPQTLRQWIVPYLSAQALAYMRARVGLVDAVIGRAVPEVSEEMRRQDPSFILTEPFGTLHLNRRAVVGDLPPLAGVYLHNDIQAYVDRKLYVHNCGHAVLAYIGTLKGIKYVHEAVMDPFVAGLMRQAWVESTQALQAEHGLDAAALGAYCDELAERFANRALSDTLERLGRDPQRKLARQDRLVGAARLCLQHEIEPSALAWAIAAALIFCPAEDTQAQALQVMLREQGLDHALRTVCQLDAHGRLAAMIRTRYEALRRGELPSL